MKSSTHLALLLAGCGGAGGVSPRSPKASEAAAPSTSAAGESATAALLFSSDCTLRCDAALQVVSCCVTGVCNGALQVTCDGALQVTCNAG